ncbi:hypothetical protein [Streptomyces sp. TP-A0356]|uniref:P-type ATPase n=1 Tax=Streptomyces sp. TP-A0356 TaxID=1359208 RepID=UPI000AF12781|nr:hypothetical protein [Streptomyces sp. TP-A0356]
MGKWRAGRAVDALHDLTAPAARVLRDGAPVQLSVEAVVVWDVVLLEAGDVVPADARVGCWWTSRH